MKQPIFFCVSCLKKEYVSRQNISEIFFYEIAFSTRTNSIIPTQLHK